MVASSIAALPASSAACFDPSSAGRRPPNRPPTTPIPIPVAKTTLKPNGRDRSVVSCATAGGIETAHSDIATPLKNAVASAADSPLTTLRSADNAPKPANAATIAPRSRRRSTRAPAGSVPAMLPAVIAPAMRPRTSSR